MFPGIAYLTISLTAPLCLGLGPDAWGTSAGCGVGLGFALFFLVCLQVAVYVFRARVFFNDMPIRGCGSHLRYECCHEWLRTDDASSAISLSLFSRLRRHDEDVRANVTWLYDFNPDGVIVSPSC
ncbi:hypothetical protein BDP55DRAFT_631977 [Colletotrichum godetiae]|uniref:Uncharacterized protein n=1 Tax=Colletotrichum godetiae TaxID=1209918 RepID=A0AAJ0AQ66_9PEZI|nr:uncharacterized protein BDP55DRAFT_631977 [Colletotrichum godetiae]KAK1675796.1 hypothetical protein BDP55DRAFT_631977 [Colletotrichum godetiae]